MSIAVSVKVHDGLVLASDSASTMMIQDQEGRIVVGNVYNNADKILNLNKRYPIGMVSWGSGGIGAASISAIAKDFRMLLSSSDPKWGLKPSYTMENVSELARSFFFKEKYLPEYRDSKLKPPINFLIAGYSANSESPEVWKVEIVNGGSEKPVKLRDLEAVGINWGGELEAIHRLLEGVGTELPNALSDLGESKEQIPDAVRQITARLEKPLIVPAMPIQDAIDLAHFLVQITIDFVRFDHGAPTVGGPIEIAAITKHEGFKWVRRKHYFDSNLNPKIKEGENGP